MVLTFGQKSMQSANGRNPEVHIIRPKPSSLSAPRPASNVLQSGRPEQIDDNFSRDTFASYNASKISTVSETQQTLVSADMVMPHSTSEKTIGNDQLEQELREIKAAEDRKQGQRTFLTTEDRRSLHDRLQDLVEDVRNNATNLLNNLEIPLTNRPDIRRCLPNTDLHILIEKLLGTVGMSWNGVVERVEGLLIDGRFSILDFVVSLYSAGIYMWILSIDLLERSTYAAPDDLRKRGMVYLLRNSSCRLR